MDDNNQKNVNDFIFIMSYKSLSDYDIKLLIKEHLIPAYSSGFRHSYSQIFATINRVLDTGCALDILTDNMETFRETLNVEEFESINKPLVKLHDHIILEISRINYFNKKFDRSISIEKEIKSMRDSLSNLYTGIEKAYQKLKKSKKDVNSLKSEIITVLSIFAAIMLGSIGGISFIGSVMSSLNNTSVYRILLMTNVAGFIVFNLVFSLLYIASRMLERNIYSKCQISSGETDCIVGLCEKRCWGISRIRRRLPYVYWVNVVILSMAVFTVIDWKFRLIGYKFLQ